MASWKRKSHDKKSDEELSLGDSDLQSETEEFEITGSDDEFLPTGSSDEETDDEMEQDDKKQIHINTTIMYFMCHKDYLELTF